jgi:histidine triad (HIT) family protein
MENCLFCKIIEKKIPASIVYEDEICLAFKDLHPQAPIHLLFIPKKHIASLAELSGNDGEIVGHILKVISDYAKQEGISDSGYRVVNNIGKNGGQTVFHIHFHLLAGRAFGWPPG